MKQDIILQAIHTKFICPTNYRGARIKATCEARSITLSWDHNLNAEDNHRKAAETVQKEMRWDERFDLVGGGLPRNKGYVFVLVLKEVAK